MEVGYNSAPNAEGKGCTVIDHRQKTELANAWIRLQYSSEKTDEHKEYFWAHEMLSRLIQETPEDCWDVILLICRKDCNDWVLANLAAGPLEDLLVIHGRRFIDEVEKEALKNEVFGRLLAGVWQNEIPDDVWRRLLIASGRS